MSDLVQRLLDRAYSGKATDALCEEAATEIERLNVAITSYAASSKAAAREINQLKTALARLADQDATFSVIGGNMIVDVDAKLTDEERAAIKMAIAACKVEGELNQACDGRQSFAGLWHDHAGALRSLLERLG
jgi:hypothetical protein